MPNVSLVKGTDRYAAVSRALELIRADVKLPDRPVLVKPNFVTTRAGQDLCITHRDAVVAVLDFLKGLGVKKFIVGDGPAVGGGVDEAADNFGYRELARRYTIEFRDLNNDPPVEVSLFDSELKPKRFQISKTVAESYVVSVARMKTHDTVVVTLAVKNVVIGCLLTAVNKKAIHAGYPAINLSMAKLAALYPNRLSVIDGVVGMEGDGPTSGTAINSGVVLASAHPYAADIVGAELMGFDPDDVGYLWYLRQLEGLSRSAIRVVGERLEACKVPFKPHSSYQEQLNWRVPDWQRLFPKTRAA